MRLFKSTLNKSQASIEDRLDSRDGSPVQPDDPYPLPDRYAQGPPSLSDDPYPAHLSQSQVQAPPQPPPLRPAQQLSRSQSGRVSSAGEAYGAPRPGVNLLAPVSPQSYVPDGPAPAPGQTQFGQARQVRTERDKDHKKSKRSFITGLIKDKSKDDDKEREREKENEPRRGLGRSSSVHLLRKSQPPPEQAPRESYSQQTSPQSPYDPRQSVYYIPSDNTVLTEIANQNPYDHYPRPPGQFDGPPGQGAHQGVEYTEDGPHFSPQLERYQAYHQPSSASTSEHYLPYQPGQPGHPDSDPHAHLRPPSQSSLGPPSPVAHPPHHPAYDSRPSTAATNRFSGQSATQGTGLAHPPQPPLQPGPVALQAPPQPPPPPGPAMARGDPANGSLRQPLSQRDPRADDHGQFANSADPRVRMSQPGSEHGRNTPPLRNRDDAGQLDYHQLLQRHEELLAKYSKVKRYYFEREAQVTQLQNTVANQRLSMSKTSLDDAQYTARFERLSQAINNLSFNIRKNWRAVPPWLRHVCNQEAHAVGTKEMTAVGRACITRWLYESIFERIFHPGIEPGLSAQLKSVERNLRRSGPAGVPLTDEQRDDLVTKITTWRLTTIEGLQDILASHQAEQYTDNLNKIFTHQLTESLKANLTDPPPPGLSEGVSMIVGQAIGIAANIPLESRDICIEYFMPGAPVNETYMKVEPQLPPLTNPGLDERSTNHQGSGTAQGGQEGPDGDGMSSASADDGQRDVEAEIREATGKASQTSQPPGGSGPQGRTDSVASSGSQLTIKSSDKQSKKSGFLGGFVGKKTSSRNEGRGGGPEGNVGDDPRSNARESMAVDPAQLGPPGGTEGRIRFAAFLAVEVRGKSPGSAGAAATSAKEAGATPGSGIAQSNINVLFKAPVYEY